MTRQSRVVALLAGGLLIGMLAPAGAAALPLSISHPTPGAGSVTSEPPGVGCTAFACGGDFPQGTAVTLTATPVKGYAFSGFSGDCSGATCTLVMDAAKNLRIDFVRFAVQTRTKVRRNERRGTAEITIRVGGPGRLALLGKGVTGEVLSLTEAANVKLPIVPRPGLSRRLEFTGTARPRIEVRFRPTNGALATLAQRVRLVRDPVAQASSRQVSLFCDRRGARVPMQRPGRCSVFHENLALSFGARSLSWQHWGSTRAVARGQACSYALTTCPSGIPIKAVASRPRERCGRLSYTRLFYKTRYVARTIPVEGCAGSVF